ncbi:MAG: hypothetical protein AAF485_00570 [Chloroflexota bacterium]
MQRTTHSFIIRIWHEAVDSQGDVVTWRGSVEHVGNQHRLNFDSLEEFVSFIQEESGLKKPRGDPWWRELLNWLKAEEPDVSKNRSEL